MGYGTTRPLERVLASCGLLTSAELEFVAADDVPNGGVFARCRLFWLKGSYATRAPFTGCRPGFYPLESIFLALALLALVRCRSLEQSRYLSPGEWGKLLGLDRLPEVKTMRRKISELCGHDGQAAQWQSRLAGEWMAGAHSESVGPLLRRRPCARLSR